MERVISLVGRIKIFLRTFSSEHLPSPPPGRERLFVSIFICAYLLWQLALPATYYFGSDKNDERFAWRMFSILGQFQKSCSVDIMHKQIAPDIHDISPRPVVLAFGAWASQLKRNRKAVVDKVLRNRCNQSPWVTEVRLVRTCPKDDGADRLVGDLRMNCVTGEVSGFLNEP